MNFFQQLRLFLHYYKIIFKTDQKILFFYDFRLEKTKSLAWKKNNLLKTLVKQLKNVILLEEYLPGQLFKKKNNYFTYFFFLNYLNEDTMHTEILNELEKNYIFYFVFSKEFFNNNLFKPIFHLKWNLMRIINLKLLIFFLKKINKINKNHIILKKVFYLFLLTLHKNIDVRTIIYFISIKMQCSVYRIFKYIILQKYFKLFLKLYIKYINLDFKNNLKYFIKKYSLKIIKSLWLKKIYEMKNQKIYKSISRYVSQFKDSKNLNFLLFEQRINPYNKVQK